MRGFVLVAATALAQMASARTEYSAAEMYTVATDGSRMPIETRYLKDARAYLPEDVPHYIELKDLEPGEYHLAIDAKIPQNDGSFVRALNLYVNGRRCRAYRACVPEEGNGVQWFSFEKQFLKSGDVVMFLDRRGTWPSGYPSRLRVRKNRLSGDVVVRVNESLAGEESFADLSGLALTPTSLVVNVRSHLGKALRARAAYVVTDYWQNELARGVLDLSADPDFAKTVAFAATPTGETRAEVRLTMEGTDRTMRRLLSVSSDRLTGMRKRVLFDDGWESSVSLGDGTNGGRLFREAPPAGAKWKKQVLPALFDHVQGKRVMMAYLRKRFTVPSAFAGARVIFKAERMTSNARVFVNGTLVKKTSLDEHDLPVAVDVTDALKSGENEIFLALQGEMSRYLESDLLKAKSLGYQDWRLPGGKATLVDTSLEARPAVAIVKKPFITTSVAKGTIMVKTETPAGCAVSHRVLYKGKVLLDGLQDGVETPFADAPFWGPTSFPLLELETTLKDASGEMCDRLSTRFGFREFTTKGMDVLWNGVPYRGYARGACGGFAFYGSRPGITHAVLLDSLEVGLSDGTHFARHVRYPEIWYDFCDEQGLPSSFSSADVPFGQMEARFLGNDTYWKAKESSDCAMVDAYGNHPSLFCWYVSNEFWIINDQRAYDLIAPSVKALKAKDPTRFIETGSDLDCRGLTQILSTHYPISTCTYDPSLWYPDLFYWRPIDGDFSVGCPMPFGQAKTIGNAHGDSLIPYGTKPVSVHETGWSVNIQRPHGTTRFYGDEGYCGFNTLEQHHLDVCFETFVGQRDANVTSIQPWRGGSDGTERAMPLVDVQLVERYHAFYAGTRASYQINVFHDIPKAETLDFFWELRDGAGRAVRKGGEELSLAGCENRRCSIAFEVPAEGAYTLAYGVRGRRARTLAVTSWARTGDEAGLLKNPCVVAGDRAITAEMLAKVEAGGVLVLLPREDYSEALPLTLRMTARNASLNYTYRPDHPALKGLTKDDLSLWYPNHVTGFGYFDKPTSGGVKTLIEAGGPKGLVYAALVEIPYGKGVIYATRLTLEPETNPVAAKLLRNLIAMPAAGVCARGRLGVVGTKYLKSLKAWGVDCELVEAKDLAMRAHEFAALFVDGSDANAAQLLSSTPDLRLFVFVQNPDPKLWGVKVNENPALAWCGSAVKTAPDHPELRGLTNYDFFWRKLSLFNIGENPMAVEDRSLMLESVGMAEIYGEEALLYPRYLARRGNILFSELNLDVSHVAVKPLAERVFTTLFANMGVASAPRKSLTLPKRFAYEPVDLTGVLNRSFVDEIENDGMGGWSDQGPQNDLREFKLLAGEHDFNGVRYRIERPNALFALTSQFRRHGNDYDMVRVDMKGKVAPWLFFLNASAWTMSMHCLSVYVEYMDGTEYEIRFKGGSNLRGWTEKNPQAPSEGETDTVTKWAFVVPQAYWGKAAAFTTAWKNPAPSKPIKALRFQSLNRPVALFMAVSIGTPIEGDAGVVGTHDAARAKALYEEGAALQKAKKYREAIVVYEEAHAADPRQLNVMNALGNCCDAIEDYAAAVKWYEKSIGTDVNQPHVHGYLNAAKAQLK